ncbi:La-related protein 1B [Zea mays]|uniref:La-related protein 1C n=1 Tax=Zea mays TaxID=4577 RepID=A0A1D6PK48_MAIZE|nr:La-related protein 1B [Zea mays]AQL09651.1 La-related protein 1C [Zea mays]AQL09652.1 La-related protein 1C [Zea mays]AQL09657.1 La-related protein 1C [Zea mays]|eukprot:NP_001336856.1 uncharacterized protein LOC100273740 [Zea mays]
MASNADQHAAVVSAAPSDSPVGAKKAGAAAAVWKLPAAAAVPVAEVVENPIMDAHSWPALPGLSSPPPPPPPHAGPTAKASPKAASPAPTGAATSPVSLGNPGAPDASHGNDARVRNPVARRALVMPAADGLEKSAPAPEPSPVYVPNARSNGADPHQNGRPGSHHHGRGGGYGGGNRRGNGGGGGRRGSEHHGGFDGQRRGGGRRDGHGPVHQLRGHQPTYIKAPVVAGAPPPPPPFVSPATPQTPPYGPPMGFHDMSAHVYYFPAPTSEGIQGLPFVPLPASPQAVLIDPSRKNLLEQIEYYFSDDNLCKDLYLRQHMDGQGWVPLSLIAGFRQVQKITNNIQFILETVMLSNIVEVQGDKLRRRGAWENWLLPKLNYSAGSSSGSMTPVTSNIDALASQFRSVGLEGATYHPSMPGMSGEALLTRSATSVSLGYHASTFGGLQSNGSEPLFGPKSARNLLRSDTF